MTDVIIPERRPAFPLREQGRYKRTVDGLDLGDLTAAVQHMYGIDGLCAASMLAHYNFSTLGSIVDATDTSKLTMEWHSHPAGRSLVVAVIAQVSESRSNPGEATIEIHEVSDPSDPQELDTATGVVLTAGEQFDRTEADGIPPQRIFILPTVQTTAVPTTEPTRCMTYDFGAGGLWPQGHPFRIEMRVATEGIRIHTIAVFEYPRATVEGA